ncbi:hypothetical protein [Bradyrhizobium sp. SEMIA]|nr:hypothetical protein [Bradyrhizobium sp. SEMIA]QOG23356.1 hypothetical protein FOM02_45050 [Bradyrhizobium sp. SEMIA]
MSGVVPAGVERRSEHDYDAFDDQLGLDRDAEQQVRLRADLDEAKWR